MPNAVRLHGSTVQEIADATVYSVEDLVKGECAFVATGITTGSLLRGVRYTSAGTVTHSVFMRSESGTVRWLTSYHGKDREEGMVSR